MTERAAPEPGQGSPEVVAPRGDGVAAADRAVGSDERHVRSPAVDVVAGGEHAAAGPLDRHHRVGAGRQGRSQPPDSSAASHRCLLPGGAGSAGRAVVIASL